MNFEQKAYLKKEIEEMKTIYEFLPLDLKTIGLLQQLVRCQNTRKVVINTSTPNFTQIEMDTGDWHGLQGAYIDVKHVKKEDC